VLYFSYGSNLNYHRMMVERCKGSVHLKNYYLKDYELYFCWNGNIKNGKPTNPDGVANIIKKSGSSVPGAIWKISDKHEKSLDSYEGYPKIYKKNKFKLDNQKVIYYILNRDCEKRPPNDEYTNIIIQGYKDCNLDREYLVKRLSDHNYNIK